MSSPPVFDDPYYNLAGALHDLKSGRNDQVVWNTIERVMRQLKAAGADTAVEPEATERSTPAADLVKRLREYCSIDKGADPIMLKVLSVVRPDLSDAADRIEALEAEVERLQVECAENERLWNEASNLAELNGEVADSAMKCAERLRAALVRIRDCDWVITLPDRMDAVREIAREALEGSLS
jgi:hypothetical protein